MSIGKFKMAARDLDTVMSLLAVLFVVLVFLLFPGKDTKDIIMIGAFIACPTKFIAVARICEVLKVRQQLT